jgi:hypothetical protein
MLKDDKESGGLGLIVFSQIYEQEGSKEMDRGNDG